MAKYYGGQPVGGSGRRDETPGIPMPKKEEQKDRHDLPDVPPLPPTKSELDEINDEASPGPEVESADAVDTGATADQEQEEDEQIRQRRERESREIRERMEAESRRMANRMFGPGGEDLAGIGAPPPPEPQITVENVDRDAPEDESEKLLEEMNAKLDRLIEWIDSQESGQDAIAEL